jgi:signal transduction histidine kinase
VSLRLRLALAGALAIVVALGMAGFGLGQLFKAHVERRAIAEMSVQLDQVLAGLEYGEPGLTLARPPADPRFGLPFGGLYWQIEAEGDVTRSRSLWDTVLELPTDTLGDRDVHVHRLSGPEGAPLLVLERSVRLSARLGGAEARAAVAMEASELEAASDAFMADLLPYLALLALTLSLAGWLQLSVGLRPLRSLSERIAALRAGRIERIGEDWPVEVRPVASELDQLLAAREAETTRARARAADLAHGLKTPLQALMGESQKLREKGAGAQADAIEDTARAMRRTVDRELTRARIAAHSATDSADAAQVASRIIAVLRRTPEGSAIDWQQDIPAGLSVALHETDLAEALGALAENAARYAKRSVGFRGEIEGPVVRITVSDDGPGIAPDERPALIRRHARADESGGGLGLSIASEIAEAAGGSLSLDTSPQGGLAATLTLPGPRKSSPVKP